MVKAFRSDDDGVLLPIDAYRVRTVTIPKYGCGVCSTPEGAPFVPVALPSSFEQLLIFMAQVLGVTRAASRESCLKASEQLLANVSGVGYSSELILSRALVLEATTNVLTDYTARRAYDSTPQIEIPYDDLPGANLFLRHPCMRMLTAC